MQLKSTKVERAFCYVTSIPHLLLIRWLVRGSLRITNRHNEVMSLSKSIERGPWEARSHTVIEELPRPSWNPKFQYCAHQSSLVVRFLVHMILHHIPTVFFFFLRFVFVVIIIIIIIYLSRSWATCWPVPVSRTHKSLQRSTMIPSASWTVVFHYSG